jgi:hypothetical protein
MESKAQWVTFERGKGTPPERAVDYREDVHEFFGGFLSITVRHVGGRWFLLFGIRLPRRK